MAEIPADMPVILAGRGGVRAPVSMRSRLVLEVASELAGTAAWPYKQSRVQLRAQGDDEWHTCWFASDSPVSVDAIANREADIAICNPGAVLSLAYHGTGPYTKAHDYFRAIMVLPQFDQLGFAVAGTTGLNSLADLRDKNYPLRLSLRGQKDHSVHLIVNEVLKAYGFTLDDITKWGGKVTYDEGTPGTGDRMNMGERGEIDAIFDEGMPTFASRALDLGWRFLAVDEPQLKQLEGMGLRRVAITREEYPKLAADVWTIDFSGWPVFTRIDVPDWIVAGFCEGLEKRKDRIPWYGQGPMRLDQFCQDTREGPLPIPLHAAAERFWHERGYI